MAGTSACSSPLQLRSIGNIGLLLQVMGKLSKGYVETTVNLKGPANADPKAQT